uniref:Uncharacterized protein n=1 Tax=Octopus bimaculoides TaxID=37653 RepID=A0A0L8G570_OCTBM
MCVSLSFLCKNLIFEMFQVAPSCGDQKCTTTTHTQPRPLLQDTIIIITMAQKSFRY